VLPLRDEYRRRSFAWTSWAIAVACMLVYVQQARLGGNLLFLLVFGGTLEDRLGSGPFAVFYLLGGALSNVA